jgi:hypothetical protein
MKLKTINEAVKLLNKAGFKTEVNTSEDTDIQEVSLNIEGRSYSIFDTSNTENHGFTNLETELLDAEYLINTASKYRALRLSEIKAASATIESIEDEF